MKIKELIKLICLALVIVIVGVLAFSGITVFTTKFNKWDNVIAKDSQFGYKYVAYYSIGAESEEDTDFDVVSATKDAVKIIEKRFESLGYGSAVVRRADDNMIRIELPGSSSVSGLESILENNGALAITSGGETVFTNADVKGVKVLGAESSSSYKVQIQLKNEAKAKLKELTSNGSYSLAVNMDGSEATSAFNGSEVVTNGKMDISFSSSSTALAFAYCVDSGAISGKITAENDMGILVSANDVNFALIFYIALAAILVLAAVYYIIAYKFMGVAATVSTLVALIALSFFAATFTWFTASFAGLLGLGLSALLVVGAHVAVLNAIAKQYASGKNIEDSLKNGVSNAKNPILEICLVAVGAGILLWIFGGATKFLGIALIGGGIIALFTALVMIKHITNLFIGIGVSSADKLGLKRGE